MKSYDEKTIELLNSTILNDEFNDEQQNKEAYGGLMSGERIMNDLILKAGNVLREPFTILNIGAGQGTTERIFEDSAVEDLYDMEPCLTRKTDNAIEGWCENIPAEVRAFNLILCWGVLCFVRSLPETLVQFNRVLKTGGFLIVDTVAYTTMPLAQTVNPDCFVRYMSMFGFTLYDRAGFGPEYHNRVGFLFKKTEDFNPARMRMPQSTGEIKNYLVERDWYLK